jgi:four helix bundle protein
LYGYETLDVWHKAHQWVLEVYCITRDFPRDEAFGLTSQLRRAAGSVPMNIVEGYRRDTDREKARFFNIAQASLDEAHYQLLLAQDLRYCKTDGSRAAAEEISRMLAAYARPIRRRAGLQK